MLTLFIICFRETKNTWKHAFYKDLRQSWNNGLKHSKIWYFLLHVGAKAGKCRLAETSHRPLNFPAWNLASL
jgi:hypothetical protein